MNFNILKNLRTKEELLNYFNENGVKITEKEIEALKRNYEKANENNTALTTQQLDDVAGGYLIVFKLLNGKYKAIATSAEFELLRVDTYLKELHNPNYIGIFSIRNNEIRFCNVSPSQIEHLSPQEKSDLITIGIAVQNAIVESNKEFFEPFDDITAAQYENLRISLICAYAYFNKSI